MAEQPTNRRRPRKKGRRKKRKGLRGGPKGRVEGPLVVETSRRRKNRASPQNRRRRGAERPIVGPPDLGPQRRRSADQPVLGPPDLGSKKRGGKRKGMRGGPGGTRDTTDTVGRTREQRKARLPGFGPQSKRASTSNTTRRPSDRATRDRGSDVDERKRRRG